MIKTVDVSLEHWMCGQDSMRVVDTMGVWLRYVHDVCVINTLDMWL